MRLLAIESSCDETAAAVVEKIGNQNITVLSTITATSSALHAKTGGIIPEDGAREQIKAIIPVIVEALLKAEGIEKEIWKEKFILGSKIINEKIDGIAVTYGPGLIGSLMVGVETAKTISLSLNKPLYPVNHLLAHIFANFINNTEEILFPSIGLIVSGGHTDLLLFRSLTDYQWISGTRDDAAGEALDKIGRLLGFPYPAGSEIERHANKIINTKLKFQSPMIHSKNFDFSFSGLKAEVGRFVAKNKLTEQLIDEICSATQSAIIDVLVKKTVRAVKLNNTKSLLLGGGVSANQTLRNKLEAELKAQSLPVKLFSPEKQYSTDNAAMIGAYALLNPQPASDWKKITATPELYFS